MRRYLIYLVATTIVLSPACQREQEVELPLLERDLTVHLEENDGGTRATVNGHYSEDNLTWLASDLIAVHLSNGEYDIVKVYPNSEDLTWGTFICSTTSEISRDYYAVYPASMVDDNNYGQDATHPLTLKLPSRYEAIGWAESYTRIPMVAVNTVTNPTGGRAHLEFYHVGGLLRITVTDFPADTKVVKVKFDKKVNGDFVVSNPATTSPMINAVSTSTESEKVITFVVADASNPVDPEEPLYLNVPVPCGEFGSVVVETFTSETATVATKSFSQAFGLAPLSIDRHHGKKLGFGTWVYEFTPDGSMAGGLPDIILGGDDVLHDFTDDIVITIDEKEGGVTVGNAPWKAYFSPVAPAGTILDDSWSETPLKDASNRDWLSLSAYEGDGDADNVTVEVMPPPSSATRVLGEYATTMQAQLQAGSGVTNLDLSRYNILKSPYASDALQASNKAETANCYVIETWGSYLIPCVYGNAFVNGTVNTSAYINSTAPGQYLYPPSYPTTSTVLNNFVNADGNAIANHVITSDGNLTKSSNLVARVVWQDTQPGFEMLKDSDLEYVSSSGTAVNCPYIRVNFRQDAIVPGNVVIALYDEDNSKILWSWHLWVIPSVETLSIKSQKVNNQVVPPTSDGPEVTYVFLTRPLGWAPPISYTGGSSPKREQFVIIVCQTNNRVVGSFKVSQAAYKQKRLDCISFSHTFYQWGRKDPFLPMNGSSSNKSISHPSDFDAGESNSRYIAVLPGPDSGSTKNERLGNMIRYPYKFFTETGSDLSPAVFYYPDYANLWNAACNSDENMSVVKTIYDPCPRGFKMRDRDALIGEVNNAALGYSPNSVPPPAEGTNLLFGRSAAQDGEWPVGIYFSNNHSFEASSYLFYVPVTGYRIPQTGEAGSEAYWANIMSATPRIRNQADHGPSADDFGIGPEVAAAHNMHNLRATAFSVRPMQYE